VSLYLIVASRPEKVYCAPQKSTGFGCVILFTSRRASTLAHPYRSAATKISSIGLMKARPCCRPLRRLCHSNNWQSTRGHDKAAKLALDYKLLNDGTIPAGILHRYEYIATPFRDLGWILLQALATLGIPGGDKSPSLYKRQGRERARF
jgi:hypothetical protein